MSTTTVAEIMASWHMDPPALRLVRKNLLSEQGEWGLYTSVVHNKGGRDANMLVHLACGRHWPNWWLAPEILGGLKDDPNIHCTKCKASLNQATFTFFWQIYRILNLRKTNVHNDNSSR